MESLGVQLNPEGVTRGPEGVTWGADLKQSCGQHGCRHHHGDSIDCLDSFDLIGFD
jgi:hypothetical protein